MLVLGTPFNSHIRHIFTFIIDDSVGFWIVYADQPQVNLITTCSISRNPTNCLFISGGLGLLGLYINENNVALINQTLETLTEYCQGPCHENQNCIAIHESNGLDIITALILNDINPLGKNRMDLVLELKNNASKLLLAIMESRGDSENAERILYNMNPKQLVDVACRAYHQEEVLDDGEHIEDLYNCDDDQDEGGVSPREVGHNIYILCHQLAQHNKELAALLKPFDAYSSTLSSSSASTTSSTLNSSQSEMSKTTTALQYYATHTAQIEVCSHLILPKMTIFDFFFAIFFYFPIDCSQ